MWIYTSLMYHKIKIKFAYFLQLAVPKFGKKIKKKTSSEFLCPSYNDPNVT